MAGLDCPPPNKGLQLTGGVRGVRRSQPLVGLRQLSREPLGEAGSVEGWDFRGLTPFFCRRGVAGQPAGVPGIPAVCLGAHLSLTPSPSSNPLTFQAIFPCQPVGPCCVVSS